MLNTRQIEFLMGMSTLHAVTYQSACDVVHVVPVVAHSRVATL